MPETLGSVSSTPKQTILYLGKMLYLQTGHYLSLASIVCWWEMMLPSTVTVYKSRRTWFLSGFKAVMFVSPRKFYVFLQTPVQAS